MSDLPPGFTADETEAPPGFEQDAPPPGFEPEPSPPPDPGAGARFLAANTPHAPEAIAQGQAHAERLGLTLPVALADPQMAKKTIQGQEVGWLAKHFPTVASWLGEEPHRAASVADDTSTLGDLAGAIKGAPGHIWSFIRDQEMFFRQAVDSTAPFYPAALGLLARADPLAAMAATKFLPMPDERNRDRIRELVQKDAAEYEPKTLVGKAVTGTVKALPYLLANKLAEVAGGAIGAALGSETGPGAVATAKLGEVSGSLVFNAFESYGPLWWKLSNYTDENGNHIDPENARVAALVGSMAQAAVMSTVWSRLGQGAPAAKAAGEAFAWKTAQQVLADGTGLAVLKRLAVAGGKNWLTGTVLMGGVNSALGDAAMEAAKGRSGLQTDWAGLPGRSWEATKQSAVDMSLISFAAPAAHELGMIYRSGQNERTWQTMVKGAADSNLLSRAPKEFQAFIAAQQEHPGAIQSVGHPVEAFDAYWKSQGADPAAVAAELAGDGGRSYTEAKATGGDVVIPVDAYLSKLGKTPHALGLKDDARLYFANDSQTMTPNESAALAPEHFADLAKKAFVRRDQALPTIPIEAAPAAPGATPEGLPPPEVTTALDAARQQTAIEAPVGDPYPSIRARHASLDPEAQARAFFIDEHSGLPNERAAERTPVEPGTIVGHAELSDIKYRNDHPEGGHDFADAGNRMLGVALNDLAPGRVFKSGTGWEVRGLKSEAELTALLDQARAALPVKDFQVTGGAGKDIAAARDAHKAVRETMVAEGKLAPSRTATGDLPQPVGLTRSPKDIQFPERRAASGVQPELSQQLAAMPPEEAFKTIYYDKESPLLSRQGFEARPPKAFKASIDLRGLRDVNEAMGKGLGDALLKAFAIHLDRLGGRDFDAAHLHGDEYAAQSNDRAALEAYLRKVNELSHTLRVGGRAANGDVVVRTGAEFWHGIGDNLDAADKDLNASKRRTVDAGGRPGSEPRLERFAADSREARAALSGSGRRVDLEEGRAPADGGRDSEKARARLQEARASVNAEVARLRAEGAAEAERETTKRAREILAQRVGPERDRIQEEVTRQLDGLPVYRAQRFLEHGELPDGAGGWRAAKGLPEFLRDENGQSVKLDRASVSRKYGADATKGLPAEMFGKGGLSADEMAGHLGFADGQDMLDQFQANEPRTAAIERRVQERLDDTYGPALKQIQEAALFAVHNDKELKAQLLELRELAKQVNPEAANRVNTIDLAAKKAAAKQLMTGAQLGSIDPERYARQERAAALKAVEAEAQGEKEYAVVQREARMMNAIMFREARDAQERAQSNWRLLQGTAAVNVRGELGKASPAYRDVAERILESVGVMPSQNLAGRADFGEFLAQAARDAHEIAFDQEGIRTLLAEGAVPWERLTVEEAQNVTDAVKSIRAAARNKNEVTIAGKMETKDAFFARLKEQLSRRKPRELDPVDRSLVRSITSGITSSLSAAERTLLTPETWGRMLDNHDLGGVIHETLLEPEARCRDRKQKLLGDVMESIVKAYPAELKRRAAERIDIWQDLPFPEAFQGRLDPTAPVTRGYLWMMFLNMGNEGNKRWLLGSTGWSERLALDFFAKHLSHTEMKFLQEGVLDNLERLYTPMADVNERDAGLRPPQIEATGIEVDGVSYRGGYFPARPDPRLTMFGAKEGYEKIQEAENVADVFAKNYQRIGVSKKHAIARTPESMLPPDLNWGVLSGHLHQVIHDIAYREFVKQSASLIIDERFNDLVDPYIGKATRMQIIPWLAAAANAASDSLPAELREVSPVLSMARSYAARTALGGNLATLGRHYWDPLHAAAGDQVSVPAVIQAYAKAQSPAWSGMREFALKNSAELQARHDQPLRDLDYELREIGKPSPRVLNAAREVRETVAVVHHLMDKFVSTVTWSARYSQSMGEYIRSGMPEAEARTKAIRDAEAIVRNVYPSAESAQMPTALRSKQFLGAALMFASFRNRMYNLKRQALDKAILTSGEAPGLWSKISPYGRFMGTLTAMSAIGTLGAYFAGRGKEHDETREQWALRQSLSEVTGDMPIAAEVGEAFWKQTITGKKAKPEFQNTPVLGAISHVWDVAMSSKNQSDEEKLASLLATLAGTATGTYTQAHRTIEYGGRLAADKAHPRGPLDVGSGLLYGKHPKQAANPLADIQTLISGE